MLETAGDPWTCARSKFFHLRYFDQNFVDSTAHPRTRGQVLMYRLLRSRGQAIRWA